MQSLITLLQQHGHVSLVSNTNKDYFYTHKAFLETLSSVIDQHSGRLDTIELSSLLGVDIDVIQSFLPALDSSKFFIFRNTITTTDYWTAILSSIVSQTESRLSIDLTPIASSLNIPIAILLSQLLKFSSFNALKPTINGTIVRLPEYYSNLIEEFVETLSSQNKEVDVHSLIGDRFPSDLYSFLVENCANKLPGELIFSPSKFVFIPNTVKQSQANQILDDVARSGYFIIPKNSPDVVELLKQNFEGQMLDSVFITSSFLSNLMETVKNESSIIDLSQFVPLEHSDLSKLIEIILDDVTSFCHVAPHHLVPIKMIDDVMEKVESFLFPKLEIFVSNIPVASGPIQSKKAKGKKAKNQSDLIVDQERLSLKRDDFLKILNQFFPRFVQFSDIIWSDISSLSDSYVESTISSLMRPSRDQFNNHLSKISSKFHNILVEISAFSSSVTIFSTCIPQNNSNDIISSLTSSFVRQKSNEILWLIFCTFETFDRFENSLPLPLLENSKNISISEINSFIKKHSTSNPTIALEIVEKSSSCSPAQLSSWIILFSKEVRMTVEEVKDQQVESLKAEKLNYCKARFELVEQPHELFHLLIEFLLLKRGINFTISGKLIPRFTEILAGTYNLPNLSVLCQNVTNILASKGAVSTDVVKRTVEEIRGVYSDLS
ncbi:hypothetical protein RCL1_001611 [Eukaryota sp. TZLM3-RCL]